MTSLWQQRHERGLSTQRIRAWHLLPHCLNGRGARTRTGTAAGTCQLQGAAGWQMDTALWVKLFRALGMPRSGAPDRGNGRRHCLPKKFWRLRCLLGGGEFEDIAGLICLDFPCATESWTGLVWFSGV